MLSTAGCRDSLYSLFAFDIEAVQIKTTVAFNGRQCDNNNNDEERVGKGMRGTTGHRYAFVLISCRRRWLVCRVYRTPPCSFPFFHSCSIWQTHRRVAFCFPFLWMFGVRPNVMTNGCHSLTLFFGCRVERTR